MIFKKIFNDFTTMADIDLAYNDLLDENTSLFLEKTEHLTTYQLNFTRAIIDDIHKDFGTVKVREEYIADPVLKVWLRRRFKWA